MANRYWVGGTGTWNTTSTTNWSATSGGTSGASAPTTADVAIFDANSNVGTGAFTVTLGASVTVNALLIGATDVPPNTALDGAMTLALGTSTLTISGSAFNIPATNLTITASTGTITLTLDPVTTYIDTHGYVVPCAMVINGGTGEEVFLSNDLTITNTLTLTSGTLRLNQKNISCTRFISNNANTRELILTWNSVDSKIFLTSSTAADVIIDMANTTGLTVTGGGTTGGFYRNQTATSTVSIGNSAGGTSTRTTNLFITGGSSELTLTSNSYFKKLDFTGSSCAVVNSASTPLFVSGDVILSSTGTYTGLEITFNGSSTVTSNGKTLQDIIVNAAGITVSLADAFSCAVFTLTQGTFNTNSFNVTTTSTSVTGTSARTLTMGSSTWTVTQFSTTIWNATTTTNLTFSAGTSTISLTSASAKTFVGGGLTYYNLNQGGTGALTITGSNTFNDITGTAQPTSIIFPASTTQTVSNFTVSGIDGALIDLQSSTAGTQFTLSKSSGTVAIQHVSIKDCNATGGATWSATNSADLGNNTGWNITIGAPKYWVGGTASWDGTAGTKWSLNSGGTGGAAIPTAANPVVFDSASGAGTVTHTLQNTVASLNFTGFTGTFAGTASIFINGSLTLGSGMTNSRTGPTLLIGTGTLTSSGKTIGALTIDALGRTITLGDAFNSAGNAAVTLTRGTLNLNNFTLSVGTFSSDNSNVRSIAFGATGDIYLRTTTNAQTNLAMNTATNFTFTGTSSVSSPMNMARSYFFGSTAGATDSNRLNINIVSDINFPNLVGTYRNLNFTGFTGSLSAATFSCHGFTLSSGGGFGNITFEMIGSGSLNFAGNTAGNININTAGITTTLASAGSVLTLLTLTNGTLDLAGFTLTTQQTTTAAGTKNLTFNGGTLAITGTTTGAWNNAQPTGFTTTAGTGTGVISMTAATSKTFTGAGSVYNCTLNQGGAGVLIITGSNTFDNISNTVQPAQVTFTSGTTSTFLSGFSLSGTPGNLISIASSTTTNHTLTKASGTISVSYCSITRSSATGGARWQAYTINGNIDGSSPGVNTGWIFTAPSSTGFFDFF